MLYKIKNAFMKVENWRIEELTGYVPITTFYTDFSIADKFGIGAIEDTYKRSFASWQWLERKSCLSNRIGYGA